jgi:hypothetical protein
MRLWESDQDSERGGGLSLDLINGASQLFPHAAVFLSLWYVFFAS